MKVNAKGLLLVVLLAMAWPVLAIAQRAMTVRVDGGSWLGVGVSDVTADKAGALKLKEERGVEIVTVSPDSPAQQAGLKEHDVVLEFNSVRVESVEQFRRMIRETPAGRTVRLLISRNGVPQTVPVKVGERPRPGRLSREPGEPFAFAFPRIEIPPPLVEIPDVPELYLFSRTAQLGIEGESLTRQLGEFFGVPGAQGVLVRSVNANSPAEKAGLKAGDVIIKVNGESIKEMGDLRSALREHARKGNVPLTVVRNKREMTLSVHLERAEADGAERL